MKRTVALSVSLPVGVLREGKQYVAFTPALDLSTSGKSHKQALDRFHKAVNIFFEECLAHGTLDESLSELGWDKRGASWQPPVMVSHEMQGVEIVA